MGEREEACERLLDNIEDAISSLERGKEECELSSWDLFEPNEMEEFIDKLREMASKLNIKITQIDDLGMDE